MSSKTVSPYGSWNSPITAELITKGGLKLGEVRVDGSDLYWLEGRPDEAGRYVVVRRTADGETVDIVPEGFNARNAVHEYGGGAYAVRSGVVYFSNWDDQRVYRSEHGEVSAITGEPAIERGERYADLTVSNDSRWIMSVRERHYTDKEADNELVIVPVDGSGGVKVLAAGYDFYSSPRQSGAGDQICWLSWNHPNLPWDGCELWLADFDSVAGTVSDPRCLTGGQDVSIVQPEWAPDGSLVFISDESGWWNLTRWAGAEILPVLSETVDHGGPAWNFGFRTYSFSSSGEVVLKDTQGSRGCFRTIGLDGRESGQLAVAHSSIADVTVFGDGVAYVGASPTSVAEVVSVDLGSGETDTFRLSSSVVLGADWLSVPEGITFPTTDDGTAHAFYYPPTNPDFEPGGAETPPLLVISHGGPTSATSASLSLSIQFWTSRGFAVADVNYRGSTGYGRPFRDALKGNWGVYDTDDCIAAADFLAGRGQADTNRVAIRGGSAGGYTTINALTFHDRFAVGATYYGIADLGVFVGDTHKFESRYLDSLIGPYPESKQLYHDRSAINFTERLSCPMIILQGLEDKIVPPSQAEIMASALREKTIPFSLIMFEGEQHGFRQSSNIRRSLMAELYFYGRVLGFEPAGNIDPVEIENEAALPS
ncbi:MAG TPA: prolyl oligopeptidase family serine peptidase [Arenicellales bacterium]|jgi:dipeptidyl aminopeptidase/acylaminoacyl peptidase|nr:prolyl oligopeptidase family serine peptidase [Arenicellales bacterium]HJP09376.1 prolyl oligopeptidase family serine peptidase [Arenicellales bacterium]|tara:strand:- start:10994 stop:12949 length:1956 start_codon:yes stop_codon:yes gene_type:complete